MTLPDTNIGAFADSEHACSTEAPGINVTSPGKRAMTGAERVAASRARKKARENAAPLLYSIDEWRSFVDPASLQRKAGAGWQNMPALVLKELADNAADAANGKGAWIKSVTLGDTEWWLIGDYGNGIAPGQVAETFSVNRPMRSSKHVRRPTRGMLGNGTRVVAGYCAIKGLPIMVMSHDTLTVLRIEAATGQTLIESQEPSEPLIGTRVFLPKTDRLAEPNIASLAEKTLALAEPGSDARSYNGPSSPWWYGATDLARLLVTAPARASISAVARDMGLRMPHGVPDGLASEATEERAATLLTALRDKSKPVPADRIGRVGKDAFNGQYPGYAIEHFIRTMPSGAKVPMTVEVWARCAGWKRRDLSVAADVDTYLNRSAVLAGVSASGGTERIHLHGAGIHYYGGHYVAAKPGQYQLIISIITPHAELLSEGKAPDFSYLAKDLPKVVGDAMTRARRGVPPDDATPEEIARAAAEAEANRQDKEAKAQRREENRRKKEAEHRAWLSIGGPRVLLRTMMRHTEFYGTDANDLTVGSIQSDPFRVDTPTNHKVGQWLKAHVPTGRKIHSRGLHYLLVSTPGLKRPDGKPYLNDKDCWDWLGKKLTIARWLGYVDFDQIEDERNAEPVWAAASDAATAPRIAINAPDLPDLMDLDDLLPGMDLAWDGNADRQRYHICLLGEKTGLRPILAPLAKEFSTDLLLDSGEPSLTHMDAMVKNAIADRRPFVILCFTDCDPTGQGIPATVARRVQARFAMLGSDLRVRIIPAALTFEQADALGLPDSPIKESDKRAKKWEAATGRGQTEIDALLALQPEVLEKMARDAIAPFYDADLAKRAREARRAWEDKARHILEDALDSMPAHQEARQRLREHHDAYTEARAGIDTAISDLRAAMEQAREEAALPDLPELPEWQAPDVPMPAALYDSTDTFYANTRRMQKAKLRDEDEEPDEDQEEDEE